MRNGDLPHSIEAEQGVLSSMMHGATAEVVTAIGTASADWFHMPHNAKLYDALVWWWQKGNPFNLELFTKRMHDGRKINLMGGAAHITAVFLFTHGTSALPMYLESLTEKYWLRYVITTCTAATQRAYEQQNDVEGILRDVEHSLMELTKRHVSNAKAKTIRDVVADVIDGLSNPEQVLGISTGFRKLDDLVGGLAPCAKIVVAGLISGGKSAFAQTLASSLAVDRKIPTVIFTFEMSAQQTAQRIIQIRSEVSTSSVARKEATMFEVDAYGAAARELADSPLTISEERLDIAGIRARCMQLKPRVAILDYLQIVPEKKQRGENRTDQLDRMSAETKQIAQSQGLTLIELSQLTDKGDGKMTTRGSKGITADSDQLWIIEGEDDEAKAVNPKHLTVAKQRDGARASVEFAFVRKITKFRERK